MKRVGQKTNQTLIQNAKTNGSRSCGGLLNLRIYAVAVGGTDHVTADGGVARVLWSVLNPVNRSRRIIWPNQVGDGR